MIKLITILFSLFSLGATWAPNEIRGPMWSTQEVKWEGDKIDQPDKGWYRDPLSFLIPKSWPEWAKSRFQRLSNGERFQKETMWEKPPLDISTKWIDAMADKNIGSIEIRIPTFNHFTFVTLDPPQGIVDQTFQGYAKIYGLDDSKQYRIIAFDSKGCLGTAVTALSEKYIRTLPDSSDIFGSNRIPVMAQKVVEDRNQDLWASVYQPRGAGAVYELTDIYAIDKAGKVKTKFEVPLTASYARPWLTDLILEDNGDLTFSASEDPTGLYSYLGTSYIARIERSGNTVWEADKNAIGVATCIAKMKDGYVYGGAVFTDDPLYIDTQLGQLCKLDSSGGVTNWPVSGITTYNTTYSVRDIKESSEGYDYPAGNATYYTDLTDVLGSCSTTFPASDCNTVFDDNDSSFISVTQAYSAATPYLITWDFGSSQTVTTIRAYVRVTGQETPHNVNIKGSADGVVFTALTNGPGLPVFVIRPSDGWVDFDMDGSWAYRYFMVSVASPNLLLAGNYTYDVAEVELTGTQTFPMGGGSDYYYYVSGRANTGGPRLFSAIQTEASPSNAYSVEDSPAKDASCYGAMDGDLSGFGFAGEGNCGVLATGCGWNDGSQSAVQSKVWYSALQASTITLQYHDGAVWQTIDSVAATADGNTHLWVSNFASVTASNWRVTFSQDLVDPCTGRLEEWQLFPASTGGGVIAKYILSGVTAPNEEWSTKYMNAESNAGIINAVAVSLRDAGVIVGVGSTEHSVSDLSLNKGMALCVNQSGTSVWYKDYFQASEWYDIQATDDGGFLLAGTLYSGTSVQARSAVVMKIDENGNIDSKFPQTFKENVELGADGRGIIETRDGGFLVVGGSSDVTNRSKPYFIKGDRFYRTCSKGDLCR